MIKMGVSHLLQTPLKIQKHSVKSAKRNTKASRACIKTKKAKKEYLASKSNHASFDSDFSVRRSRSTVIVF